MKRCDVEFIAELLLIFRTLRADIQLSYFVRQCLTRQRHVTLDLRSSLVLRYQLVCSHVCNGFFTRHSFMMQSHIDNQAYSPMNGIAQVTEVLIRIIVYPKLLTQCLTIERPPL